MVEIIRLTRSCFLLQLNPNCKGALEAAQVFAEGVEKLRKMFPDKRFQFLNYQYDMFVTGRLTSMLAIAD